VIRGAWRQVGAAFYNSFVTYLPGHALRCAILRIWGASVGSGVAVGRGTTVLGIHALTIGSRTKVGRRCLLDARGRLELGTDVEISDDVQFITAHHDPQSDTFEALSGPIVVADHVWIASRATVLEGVAIGRGAVVAAESLVRLSVEPLAIVAGIPAKVTGERQSSLAYSLHPREAFA